MFISEPPKRNAAGSFSQRWTRFLLSTQVFPHVFLNFVCGMSQTALFYKYLQYIEAWLVLLCLKWKCALQHRLFSGIVPKKIHNTINITILKNPGGKRQTRCWLEKLNYRPPTAVDQSCTPTREIQIASSRHWTSSTYTHRLLQGYPLKQNSKCHFPFRQEYGKAAWKA